MPSQMRPSRLYLADKAGAGLEISASLGEPVGCAEFTMRGDRPQAVLVACEPWIQFAPAKWRSMQRALFQEMVDAWNERHATKGA